MNGFIPMIFAVSVEGWEHDRQNGRRVVTDQTHDVPGNGQCTNCMITGQTVAHSLIIPVVESPLGHLEVWAGHALGELREQRHHHLLELRGLDHVKDLLELVEEHDLLGAVDLGPEPEQGADDGLGEGGVLLQELHHAVGQLRVVHRQRAHLVQRHQDLGKIFTC